MMMIAGTTFLRTNSFLLAGAGGLIGGALVRHLPEARITRAAAGKPVIAITLTPSSCTECNPRLCEKMRVTASV
jgi:hypothetical protein